VQTCCSWPIGANLLMASRRRPRLPRRHRPPLRPRVLLARRPRRGMETRPVLRVPPRLRGELETARGGDAAEGDGGVRAVSYSGERRGVSPTWSSAASRSRRPNGSIPKGCTHQPRVAAAHPRADFLLQCCRAPRYHEALRYLTGG
jgi:hypothetical protein